MCKSDNWINLFQIEHIGSVLELMQEQLFRSDDILETDLQGYLLVLLKFVHNEGTLAHEK